MNPPQPIAKFRVFAHASPRKYSTLYFIVKVFATKKEMHSYMRSEGREVDRKDDAYTYNYEVLRVRPGEPNRKRPIMGEIVLNKKKCRAGLLSHECFHATMSYLRRIEFDFARLGFKDGDARMNIEERAAYVQGEFMRQVVVGLNERGL
jgi:hypothetical protein